MTDALFVKTAGLTGGPAPGAAGAVLRPRGPGRLLRNAVELAASSSHPALPRLLNVIESPSGPALVYEAVEGELLHARRAERSDPASAGRSPP